MKALTAIAATAYAIGLWMFAPQSRWEREVQKARRNQQQRLTPTPDTVPAPESVTVPTIKPDVTPKPDPKAEPTSEQPETTTQAEIKELLPDTNWTKPDTSEPTFEEPQQPDYNEWTTTQLREEAKERKLNWRPLINGKRTPLKKPDLIELLTA